MSRDLRKVGNLVVRGWAAVGGAVLVEALAVAPGNMIQSRFTTSSATNTSELVTRIKLVASLLPLTLGITLVVMVARFCRRCWSKKWHTILLHIVAP